MATNHKKIKFILSGLLFLSILGIQATAQPTTAHQVTDSKPQNVRDFQSKADEIVMAMKNSADDWNRGDTCRAYMNMYTEASTMMMPTGPAGLSTIRDL